MHIFGRPHYTSDATQFIEQLEASDPKIGKGEIEGRALLWDQQIDRNFQSDAEAARVAQQPYVYQTQPDPH